MSKPELVDNSTPTKDNKQPRLNLQDQIQRAVALTTQLCHAASKEHLGSTEWTANQVAANELLRTFENMQEKVASAAESIEGLIATQIKLEVKIKMIALQSRIGVEWNRSCSRTEPKPLSNEIENFLAPSQIEVGERIAKIARENLEGDASADLTAKVSEAVESAILEEFHEGIDKQMRSYWT